MRNGIGEKNKEGNKKIWKRIKIVMRVVLYIGVLVFVLAVFPWNIFDLTEKITLAQIVTFAGAVISLLLIFQQLRNQGEQLQHQEKRLQNQEKQLQNQEEQIKSQIDQRVDDRFTISVELLGNAETSTRTGAIYLLYQLAVDDKKYRSQIVRILCSHLRSKTSKTESLRRHKDPFSNEIQTTIDLLVREVNNTKGLYCQNFDEILPIPNFTHAYLVGVNFSGAQCQNANFAYAQCQGAKFVGAECQSADFRKTQCQGADFSFAQCKDANFAYTQCQGTKFIEAECQGADFNKAECQDVNFSFAQCKDANFSGAQYQGAKFMGTECQGADFRKAECQGVNFSFAQCKDANFSAARCQGADFRKAECQEAYAVDDIIIAGEFSEDDIWSIKIARKYCSEDWYEKMQEIIEDNKGKRQEQGVPEGIIIRGGR